MFGSLSASDLVLRLLRKTWVPNSLPTKSTFHRRFKAPLRLLRKQLHLPHSHDLPARPRSVYHQNGVGGAFAAVWPGHFSHYSRFCFFSLKSEITRHFLTRSPAYFLCTVRAIETHFYTWYLVTIPAVPVFHTHYRRNTKIRWYPDPGAAVISACNVCLGVGDYILRTSATGRKKNTHSYRKNKFPLREAHMGVAQYECMCDTCSLGIVYWRCRACCRIQHDGIALRCLRPWQHHDVPQSLYLVSYVS